MAGLKQMVQQALDSVKNETELPPVQVSGEVMKTLNAAVKKWSGKSDATFVNAVPVSSPFANYHPITHVFTACIDRASLNPNRVMLTMTPFRMRQEAVLTGLLLHEASHARYSTWRPDTAEEFANWKHPDGSPVTKQELALALLCEEARIEGLMAHNEQANGALGLGWTMRAMAAHLIPTTQVHLTDKNQQVMDVIESWVLRAGRQWALKGRRRVWVSSFDDMLRDVLSAHIEQAWAGVHPDSANIVPSAQRVFTYLTLMVQWDGRPVVNMSGFTDLDADEQRYPTFMVDRAKDILQMLFPETDTDDMPEPSTGCAHQDEAEVSDDSDTEDADEAEAEVSDDSDTEDADEAEADGDEAEADGDEADADGEDADADGEDADANGEAEPEPEPSELQRRLSALEQQAESAEDEEAEAEMGGSGASEGGDSKPNAGGFRGPSLVERDLQKGAEVFLRGLIAPSETSTLMLSDSPAATVNPAALAAWRAGGSKADPRFFIRRKRAIEQTPPVKIAVLVDVSGSMSILQEPSAVLSWALSSAALDLRNFAGRGAQIESMLIHWGDNARVVQNVGQTSEGIHAANRCTEGTDSMDEAFMLVEQQMPGFFDASDKPENRLIVQFTDWQLSLHTRRASAPYISRALAAGVNMISVMPGQRWGGSTRLSLGDLPGIIADCPVQRGRSTVMQYNPSQPGAVWQHAAEALA